MKILLIISQFKPAQDPNTLRWSALTEQLDRQGHEVTILTTRRDPFPVVTDEDNIRIYRTGHNSMRDFLYNKVKKRSRRHEPGYVFSQGIPARKLLKKTTDVLYRSVYWPDGSWLFLNPGTQKARDIVSREGISHIISVGAPFTCHLIGGRLKEQFPHLHWHMDIEDPFSFALESRINNPCLYHKKNFRTEKACLRQADTISLTNERALEKYHQLFPFINNKTRVIPPVFIPCQNQTASPGKRSPGKTSLAWFGSFYENVRSPENFLHFLELLTAKVPEIASGLEWHFIGQQNSYSRAIFDRFHHLSDIIHFHGFLTRNETMARLAGMDVLLNIGNKTDYHLPSRAVEYLYLNKPILNFTEIREDSLQAFLAGYPNIHRLHLGHGVDETTLDRFVDFIQTPRIATFPNPQNVVSYMPESIVESYLECLNSRLLHYTR